MKVAPYIGQVIRLTDSECKQAEEIVEQIRAYWTAKGVHEKNYDAKELMEQNDVNGMAAKMAFAKLFDDVLDPRIGPGGRYSGNNCIVYDFIVDGCTIKVSSTKYPDGVLLGHPHLKKHAPDFYALMVGEKPEFVFKGFFPCNKLFNDERYVRYFKGTGQDAFVAEQDELLPCLP